MAADTNKASMASLSSAQLAERLEKSEAGRKKLRQAISILQEKLDATDKVLKINDTLRQECEQERRQAETEKKKAEEEKRLRSILEKDSATFKDQLAKVFQRLGAVENKQKADKKELERVRNEVKLSVEGMRVASQAVDSLQNSFQILENNVLEKVNSAFEEAHAASQAVHHVQSSLQSLENTVVKKGASPDNELALPKSKPVPEKLLDDISRLFNRERQSHCKIEQRLSMLKSVLKSGGSDNPLTNAEDSDLEDVEFSKKKKNKRASRKRRSRGEEDFFVFKARKREKLYATDVVNSAVNRTNCDGLEQSKKGQCMSSPLLIEYQTTSDEQGCLPQPPSNNTASNDYIEEVIMDHRGSSNGNVPVQSPPVGSKVVKQKEDQRDLTAQLEKTIVSGGCLKNTIVQNEGSSEVQPEDDFELIQSRRVGKLADQEENPQRSLNASCGVHSDDINEASDFDLNFLISNDSEDEWWSKERTLLSPSLPEIPSPLHHSPCPSREPSPSRGFSDSKVDTGASFDLFSSINPETPVRDASVLTEVATNRADIQGAAIVHSSKSIEACIMPLDVSSQRSSSILSNSTLQPGSVAGAEEQPNSNPEIESNTGFITSQFVHSDTCTLDAFSSQDVKNAFQEIRPIPKLISTTMPEAEILILSDKQEKETQFDEDYTFEAVDSATITEISNFLEVLPPIPTVFPDELCISEMVMADGNNIGPSNKICAASQPQAVCEMQMLKPIDTKHSVSVGEDSHDCTIVQGLPSQEEAHDIEAIRNRKTSLVLERSSGLDPRVVLTSNTNPSSPCVVFLLHAFDLREVDVAIKVTAACIIAINFKRYLPHANADKEEMQLEVTKLSRASADVPLEYLACSFISSAVDLVRLEKGGQSSPEAQSIYALVQAFVPFVRSMFKEKANIMFDNIFSQLGRFLIHGEAMLITLQGLISPCEDALSVARVIHEKKHHSYQYTEATLKDIHAGGKVLAALCQVLSCVTHLQNILYEVLGWCDKDIMWLLTVFSSFSSICGDTAFMVETDDLLGHAICAIIIELVASVEQELMRSADCTVSSQATQGLADGSPNVPMEWAALKETLEVNGKFSVEEVFVAVLEALQCIFSSTHEALVPASQPLLKKARQCSIGNIHTRMREGTVLLEREAIKDSVPCQDLPIDHKSMNLLSVKQRDSILKNSGPDKWQRKYVEAVGALELIAQFMGWEWTYNHLIVRCLWKMLVSGSAQLCVAGVSHILSILVRLGVKGGGTDLPGLAELKKCLVHIVQSTSAVMGKEEPILLFDLQ